MTHKKIINEANKILVSLQKLQERARKIVVKATDDGIAWLPPHIQEVIDTLDDLVAFDLEDCIVNAYDYEN